MLLPDGWPRNELQDHSLVRLALILLLLWLCKSLGFTGNAEPLPAPTPTSPHRRCHWHAVPLRWQLPWAVLLREQNFRGIQFGNNWFVIVVTKCWTAPTVPPHQNKQNPPKPKKIITCMWEMKTEISDLQVSSSHTWACERRHSQSLQAQKAGLPNPQLHLLPPPPHHTY